MSLWKDKNSQEKKECKERRRKFLLAVADKPLKIQIDKYFGVIGREFEAINKEFEAYKVENSKLSPFLHLNSIDAKIEKNIESTVESSQYYVVFDESLSKNKKKQYKDALVRNELDNWYEKLKIRFYITTEWIMEDWANKNNLDYVDYNEISPFSPQDCKLDGVDIDVKTTVSIGSYHGLPYFTRNNQVVKDEVQVAITSSVPKSDDKYSHHFILGIFDSSKYELINLDLNFLSIDSHLKNPCYFHPLQDYFFSSYQYEDMDYDKDVIEYWLQSKNITAIAYSISNPLGYFENALKSKIGEVHHGLITIVLELISKKSLYLLPHYFADYLIQKIQKKENIEINLKDTIFSIYKPNEHQEVYIDNLFKLFEILPKVRCKWHPEEGIRDMEIKFIDGYIPTFQAVCSQDPEKQTTIYTYSWKTGQTLIYSSEFICSSPECGGLTHKRKDYESKQMKIYCKASCNKFGREAHKSKFS
jgi:hypothetical protein